MVIKCIALLYKKAVLYIYMRLLLLPVYVDALSFFYISQLEQFIITWSFITLESDNHLITSFGVCVYWIWYTWLWLCTELF